VTLGLATTLRSVTAIVLLYSIVRFVDWSTLGGALYHLHPTHLFAALAAFVAISLCEAWRLRVAMPPGALSFGYAFKLHIIGSAFANVTPAQIGGDAYKAARLGSEGHDVFTLSVLLVSLRSLGFVVMVIGACVALAFDSAGIDALGIGQLERYGPLAAACVVLLVLSIGFLLARGPLRNYWLRRPIIATRDLVTVVAITGAMLFLRACVMLFVCRSVGVETGLQSAMLVATLSLLATWLPISIAGAGVREGVIVILLTQVGANYEQSFAVALVGRLFMICQGLAGVAWWMVQRGGRN
jgi:glycosyltransferase 2 family protein